MKMPGVRSRSRRDGPVVRGDGRWGNPGPGSLVRTGFVVLGLLAWMPVVHACEPVFPLMILFGGNLMYGLISLPVVVGVKCIAFMLLEKQLTSGQALKFMLVANLYSSLFGFVVVLCFAVPLFALFSPLVIWLSVRTPARRLLAYVNRGRTRLPISPNFLASGLVLIFLASVLLFGLAGTFLEGPGRNYIVYWILKFLYVAVGISLSVLLTACWEEHAIARQAERVQSESSFFEGVLRSNYIAFIVLLLIGALAMLPTRLRSRGFLFDGAGW